MNGTHKVEHNLDDRLDAQIRAALQTRAEQAKTSADLDEVIRRGLSQEISCRSECARHRMKGFGRKLAVAFCALFCLSCCAVVADVNSVGSGWVSQAAFDDRFDSFDSVAAVVETLDYTPNYLESLAGGYIFQEGHISHMQRLDDNGHRMSHVYKNLFMDYLNPATGECITLVAGNEPNSGGVESGQEISRMLGDIKLVYVTKPYKFVPVDYALTDADKAALADGSLEISVGSDEVERMLNVSVFWTQEGVNYHLFGWDLSLTAEEMLDVAADFVERTGGLES